MQTSTAGIRWAQKHGVPFPSRQFACAEKGGRLLRWNRRRRSLLARRRATLTGVPPLLDVSFPGGSSSSFSSDGGEASCHAVKSVSPLTCPPAWLSFPPRSSCVASEPASRCASPPDPSSLPRWSCPASPSFSSFPTPACCRRLSILSQPSRPLSLDPSAGVKEPKLHVQGVFAQSLLSTPGSGSRHSFSPHTIELAQLSPSRVPASFSFPPIPNDARLCRRPIASSPRASSFPVSSAFSHASSSSASSASSLSSSGVSPSSSSSSRSRKVHLIDDPDDCDAILDELFFSPSSSVLLPPSPLTTYLMVQRQISPSSVSASPFLTGDFSRQLVALDCEGVALGRFGRMCTVQIATSTHTLLLDAFKTGVVGGNKKLKEILESPHIVKVCHDCREDASALLHQHTIRLRNVFDTQVAHQIWSEQKGETRFQASLSELFRSFLNLRDGGVAKQAKSAMEADPSVWCQRPLPTDLLRYAVFGVSHLLDLAHILAFHLSSCNEVIRRSCETYLPYRHLNTHLNSPAEIATPGAVIQGMVAARTCMGLTLKLNCGRNGVVSTPAALSRFHDVNVGDIVDVQVASQSQDGKIVYLDRYDGLYNYWNLKERPRTRHQTAMALTSESQVDPLLLLRPDEDDAP